MIMPNNQFIDREINCVSTNKNDETSETSKGHTEKGKIQKMFICQSSTCLNVNRINSVHQAERLSVKKDPGDDEYFGSTDEPQE